MKRNMLNLNYDNFVSKYLNTLEKIKVNIKNRNLNIDDDGIERLSGYNNIVEDILELLDKNIKK